MQQVNQTKISCTFEERHAPHSEPFVTAHRHAPLSEPQYEPTYDIYPSFQQGLNRTRQESQNQNSTITNDRQKIHPRRNRTPTTPRSQFNIPSSPTSNPPLIFQIVQSKAFYHLQV